MFVGRAALFVGCFASHLARCSTLTLLSVALVRPPAVAVAGQEHRLALHHNRNRRRRRSARCLRCAAVALAVSGRSTCEADELDDGASRPTAVDGEVVVLSDWLEKSRHEGRVEVVSSLEEQRGGGRDSSPPHRFQELIQHMWAELSRGSQLEYLGREGQEKVKGALTVLAAYCALREHPLQAGVDSPQQAFSEMDFNRDGEVSFDEFVRWYSMSSALDEPQQTASGTTPAVAANGEAAPPPSPETALARVGGGFATESLAAPTAPNGRGSRLLADVEKSLALAGTSSTPAANQSPRSAAVDSAQQTEAGSGPRAGIDPRVGTGPRAAGVEASARGQWPALLAPPPAASLAAMATAAVASAGLGSTEEEKETAREHWLAGGAADAGTGASDAKPADGGDLAAQDLDKALKILGVLVKAHADADTLVAALASQIIRNPTGGNYNLEVIEEQFGPIIRGIVEDRLLLERLPEPTSATSYLAIQQSYGVKPVLDLDDNHAKLMRDFLVHSSRDARAVVVHMADLTCRLREPSNTPVASRHSLALEALQLYVPVSNALGLGSSFRELEELGYKTIFPQTYANMALWHRDVKGQSHNIVQDVKRRMLEALHAREDIASRVHRYRIEGRTKGLVSTFRKVFRQNKRAMDVHDIIGFRVIVSPGSLKSRSAAAATGEGGGDTPTNKGGQAARRGEGQERVDATHGSSENRRAGGKTGGSKPARAVFTVKTFPPPYRDADSRLLHDVYEVLIGMFDEVPGRFKNYVDFPKKNGYRSVHTTVVHSTGLKMEFQVRTAHMHAEAEGGTASHSLYKGSLENPEEASLFRSKMAPNVLSPAHRLPAKAESRKAAVIEPAPDSGVSLPSSAPDKGGAAATTAAVPLVDVKVEEIDLEGGGRITPDRSPEP